MVRQNEDVERVDSGDSPDGEREGVGEEAVERESVEDEGSGDAEDRGIESEAAGERESVV